MIETGRIYEVSRELLGSTVYGTHAAGVTTVTMTSVVDFAEQGGMLTFVDPVDDVTVHTVAYSSVDTDADTITLAAGLPAAVATDTFIGPYPALHDVRAQVMIDGEGELLSAIVPQSLRDKFPEGVRDAADREGVTVVLDESGEWSLSDAHGGDASIYEPSVEGGTITGTLFRTSAEPSSRVELSDSSGLDDLRFYSGDAGETAPGRVGAKTSVLNPGGNYLTEFALEAASPQVAAVGQARLELYSYEQRTTPGGAPFGTGTGALLTADSVRLSGDLYLDGRIKEGLKVGENSMRTTIMHAASVVLTVSGGAGLATWNHGLNLGTMVYQVLVTSRNNAAERLFTIDAKAANAVTFRVANPTTGAVVPSGGTASIDVLVIG